MAEHDDEKSTGEPAADTGCMVDWSWLSGLTIESATSDLQHWRVRFTNGLTLTIQTAMWKDQPFLAFQPWKAPGS